MEKKKDDYCPAMSGSLLGYQPEIFLNKKWCKIPTRKAMIGVPSPLHQGGILVEIGLSGYSQAMTIAHGYAAEYEARGHPVKVRIIPYEVSFSIKAKRREEKTEEPPNELAETEK